MVTPALLLLLVSAVAAADFGNVSIAECPITFYGRTYSHLELRTDEAYQIIFPDDSSSSSRLSDYVSATSLQLPDMFDVSVHKIPGVLRFGAVEVSATCWVQILGLHKGVVDKKFYFFRDSKGCGVGFYKADAATVSEVKIFVESSEVSSQNLEINERHFSARFEGCRYNGHLQPAVSTRRRDCIETNCSENSTLTINPLCPHGKCFDTDICSPMDLVCTVSGPSVISFFGTRRSIPDRCDYTLLRYGGSPDIRVVAQFRERRRMDVPLLDTVVVTSGDSDYVLGQNGSLMVNQRTVELSHAPTTVGPSLTATKDHRELALRFVPLDLVVLFDGNTLHVAGKQHELRDLDGLCTYPSDQAMTVDLSEEKDRLSPSACEEQHPEAADGSINCSAATQHCELLSQAPFSACHSKLNPRPYIEACVDLLCRYPPREGAWCQLLEAYASSCSLKKRGGLQGWRTAANCPARPVFCGDKHCSSNEFCLEESGTARCACRPVYAHRGRETLGSSLTCVDGTSTVSLATCLLEERGIDYRKLHLNDPTCTGVWDPEHHLVYFSFNRTNTCASKTVVDSKDVVFQNTVMQSNRTTRTPLVSGRTQVLLDFTCSSVQMRSNQDNPTHVSFKLKVGYMVQMLTAEGYNFRGMLQVFDGPEFTTPTELETETPLDTRVWIRMKVDGLNEWLHVVLNDECWATNVPEYNASLRYPLINRGCPNQEEGSVEVRGNGLSWVTSFSFQMFQFTSEDSELYLHCLMRLCRMDIGYCAPDCLHPERRRRASWAMVEDTEPAIFTLVWQK